MKRLAILLAVCNSTALAGAPAPEARTPGLSMYVYDIGQDLYRLQELVPGQTPNVSKVVTKIDLKNKDFGVQDQFVVELNGFINIDKSGRYEFQLNSDDGSELIVDGATIVNHDFLHGATQGKSDVVELKAGEHPIRLRMFDNWGDAQLTLKWKLPGTDEFELIPEASLFTVAGAVQVTSPGTKQLVPVLSNVRPGDGLPLVDVHPAFTKTTLHHDGFTPRVGGIDFFPDGRMVLCAWEPTGDVYIIENPSGDPSAMKVKRFAHGLAEPLGVKVVDGAVYVLQKHELTKLVDRDGDGVADEYLNVCDDWKVTPNFHEFAFGLVYKDGFFYANLAVAIDPGGRTTVPQVEGRGRVIRIDPKTGKSEPVAMGIRTPNGIGLMPSTGDIFITDNQGDWLPSSKLIKLREGAFYGAHVKPDHAWGKRDVTPPVAWLPQGEIGNSPSQPAELVVGPWKGQIIHGDVTHGGLKRTFVETIGDVDNGCVFRFSQGFTGGVNRIAWGPDNQLYVGQIGSTGNWGQTGKKWFGLERLTFNGTGAFEPLAVRVKSNGMEIEFTEPLAKGSGEDLTHYTLRSWRYNPTNAYGGSKVDEKDLEIRSVTVSEDRKRVFIESRDLRERTVVYLRCAHVLRSASGKPLWTTEAWYTLNKRPDVSVVGTVGPAPKQNELTEQEKADGWQLLFDGKTTKGWRGFKQKDMPKGWEVVDGSLMRTMGGGDIITEQEFGDFELSLEWKVAEKGNSGIFLRVDESLNTAWASGPEMQVLDNARHNDGRSAFTSAGAAYALYAPSSDPSLGANKWNHAQVIARGSTMTFKLNGEVTAEFDMSSDDWKERLAKSKFNGMMGFGTTMRGRIGLQDHGDRVGFRNIKIRELK
jgi:cytochrome c